MLDIPAVKKTFATLLADAWSPWTWIGSTAYLRGIGGLFIARTYAHGNNTVGLTIAYKTNAGVLVDELLFPFAFAFDAPFLINALGQWVDVDSNVTVEHPRIVELHRQVDAWLHIMEGHLIELDTPKRKPRGVR